MKKPDQNTINKLLTTTKLPGYELVTEKEAAVLLKRSVYSLQRDRVLGCGCPYVAVGRGSIRYRLSTIAQYIEKNERQSTSQTTGGV